MCATRSLLIIGIFCLGSVISEKVECDFDDSKCLTYSSGLKFDKFIEGVPGTVASSEPLYQKHIEANLPTLTYKFFEAELSGMKSCKVELVKISGKDLKYDYHIGCSQLTLNAKYELNGDIGPQHLEGKGDCKVDFYDYHFQFHGDYSSKVDKDGNGHINLATHELVPVVNGKVEYEFKNLFNGDKEESDKAHNYINTNWNSFDEPSLWTAMKAFGDNYITNVNAFLDYVPAKELFSYEK